MSARRARIEFGRWTFFIIGVAINSFGIALITKGALGTSAISSPAYVLSLHFPFTLGQGTFVMNTLFIVAQMLLLRKDFKPFQILQLAVNVVFSAAIDISMGMLWWLNPQGVIEGLLAVVAGSAILGFGVAVEVAPNVLVVPGEGIVRAISIVTHKRLGSVKRVFDCSLVLLAVVFSLTLFGCLRGVGAGTIISAFIVGGFVNFYNKHVPLIGFIVNLRIHADELKHKEAAAKIAS